MSLIIIAIREKLLFLGLINAGLPVVFMFITSGSFEALFAQIPSLYERSESLFQASRLITSSILAKIRVFSGMKEATP
jgi:hypothetical protein